MVKLIIDGNDVSEFVLEDHYKVNITSNDNKSSGSTGNVFTNHDGTPYYIDGNSNEAQKMPPYKITINAELAGIADGFDLFASAQDDEAKVFEVEYSTPVSREGYFKCVSYSAEVDENDYDSEEDSVKTWTVSLTLESTAAPSDPEDPESGGL